MNAAVPLRVYLVDDEPLARERLRSLVATCVAPAAEVVGEAAQAQPVWDGLAQTRAQVLLLDVQMPGLDGLQLAQRLRAAGRRVAVVFVTAHAEHALAAFEVEAVDYLTKPVRRLRLQEALGRAATWLGRQPGAAPAAAAAPDEPVIVVQQRGEVLRVPVREVLYLRAEQKYVEVRTAAARHLMDGSLAEWGERLGERFVRIHRNALVARGAMRRLARRRAGDDPAPGKPDERPAAPAGPSTEQWAVLVAPVDEWLMVSRRQLGAVREALEDGA